MHRSMISKRFKHYARTSVRTECLKIERDVERKEGSRARGDRRRAINHTAPLAGSRVERP